ncbi:MAG: molybdopterin-binding protein, partial [Rhodospirillales bacterium]
MGQAAGGLLAHGIRGDGFSFKKGRVLSSDDVALLVAAGCDAVVVARLEPDEAGEDEAAAAIAGALAGSGIAAAPATTGRANLHATALGVLQIDALRIHEANRVDEAMTVATLADASVVRPGQLLATVKIIPFAVPGRLLARCLAGLRAQGPPVLSVAAFRSVRAGLVQTRLPGLKASLLKKMQAVTAGRLAALGSTLAEAAIVDHEQQAVATAILAQRQQGLDPILVATASAVVDRRDVVPAAIVACGGKVVHFGMPVDPGNLLLLGRLGGAAVIGMPGCARSPQANGLDMVLSRLLAGLPVGPEQIMGWGVGGLLTEIPQRPQPRESAGDGPGALAAPAVRIAAIILAAGQGTRMG